MPRSESGSRTRETGTPPDGLKGKSGVATGRGNAFVEAMEHEMLGAFVEQTMIAWRLSRDGVFTKKEHDAARSHIRKAFEDPERANFDWIDHQ